MSSSIPDHISKYAITRVLGQGSMGVVYEGFDPDIERKVAIKTLINVAPSQDTVDDYHSRFKVEAQASARCNHPNIVSILEYGELKGMPYMVMEYIDGNPLDEILKMTASLTLNQVLKIFSQLLKGLNCAHNAGVVHRDIKPSNIMFTADESVKITDFGIARLPVNSNLTQVGFTVGTLNYMAPEQEVRSDVDSRADLFSLTVILLELLAKVSVTGRVPHRALSPLGIYITPRVDMNQLFPVPFLSVLQTGLAYDVQHRYQSAQEYASAIKFAVKDLQTAIGVVHAVIRPNKLKKMEVMLVNFIGPVATSYIDMYKEEYNTTSRLAVKIAEEISDLQDRESFLRAWKSDEEITDSPTVNTAQIATRMIEVDNQETLVTAVSQPQKEARRFHLDKKDFTQLVELYAQHVGPMAEILLSDMVAEVNDMEDLVDSLVESIPSTDEQTDFKIKVRELSINP